jgi:hypothetical protein
MRTRQEWVGDWVRSNDTLVRGLPIFIGGVSLLAVLLNRAVSGIAAVSDASRSPYPALTSASLAILCFVSSSQIAHSGLPFVFSNSSQSRADILTLALSVTDILAGLVWLSIRPKSISPVRKLSTIIKSSDISS